MYVLSRKRLMGLRFADPEIQDLVSRWYMFDTKQPGVKNDLPPMICRMVHGVRNDFGYRVRIGCAAGRSIFDVRGNIFSMKAADVVMKVQTGFQKPFQSRSPIKDSSFTWELRWTISMHTGIPDILRIPQVIKSRPN